MLKCWKCGVEKEAIKEVFCSKCNFIQEPHDTKNFFQLFDIKESFDIDTKLLTNSYRRLQNIIHPDKFSNKSSEEKNISQEYSSLINRAYNTLQLPLNRALHILQLKGEKIDEDQKVVDTEFLMKIMEINEEIENAENPEQLKMLNEQNKRVISEICKKISICFKNNDIEEAKRYIVQLKYYNSISHHVNGILRTRGIVD
ncbi:iron-sulfur cluster co-chaperone protein HscB, mitochondrial isoform X2 [Agrilus planipennis]|nr:iron-sulfur cluster co-chaperone protein HscB, mitochondrial isoform X2 [Agrilus planipennis]